MKSIIRWIVTLSEWSGKVLSMLIFVLIGVLIFEVTLRYLFNAPTIWAHELSQHLFGAYSVLAGAYILLHFGHVNVDFLHSRVSPRGKAILNLVTSPLFFLFTGLMLVAGVKIAWHSLEIMETSFSPWHPPIYPLKLTVPIGAFLIILQGLGRFVSDFAMAIKGRA